MGQMHSDMEIHFPTGPFAPSGSPSSEPVLKPTQRKVEFTTTRTVDAEMRFASEQRWRLKSGKRVGRGWGKGVGRHELWGWAQNLEGDWANMDVIGKGLRSGRETGYTNKGWSPSRGVQLGPAPLVLSIHPGSPRPPHPPQAAQHRSRPQPRLKNQVCRNRPFWRHWRLALAKGALALALVQVRDAAVRLLRVAALTM
eukprot:scaffold53580_cov65-Phaeocystis_antarctica.AAC.2